MAKYTVELNDIIKSGYKLFDFDYTFYDETKKPEFEDRFLDYYRFHEIGVETVARFQHNLKVTFIEKLPYYNMLLETALYDYDIINNYNLTETFTKTINKNIKGNANQTGLTSEDLTHDAKENKTNSSTGESTADNTQNNIINNKDIESDTPSGLLSMVDIENNVYASKAKIQNGTNEAIGNQKTTGTSTDTGETITENNTISKGNFSNDAETETTEAGTEDYTLEKVGDIGIDTTPDKLKKHIEIQKVLTTIYEAFFIECNDLFMQIY